MVTGKLRLTPAGLDLKLRESNGKGAEAPVLSPTSSPRWQMGLEYKPLTQTLSSKYFIN